MESAKKKKLTQRIILLTLLVAAIVLIVFFFKDIIVPFVRYEVNKNFDEAQELLHENRLLGYLCVALVPGLQMVVVIISAEFIQIAAGLAYNPFLAIGLLDLGVVIGASIIWVLVHTFKFDTSMFAKSTKKIEKIAKMNRNTQLLMFFLFFMPFIPYGAICYFGSSTKISYRRYILTCALGCLPSIVTSIFLGKAIRQFITKSMPLWLLLIIVLGCAIILFVLIFLLLWRFVFKNAKGTPDSPLFSIIYKYSEFKCNHGKKYNVINQEKLEKLVGPAIIIANHPSKYDYYRIFHLMDKSISCICDRKLLNGKFRSFYGREVGLIPKKMFDPDVETIIKTKRMLKRGYSVLICPEGRLSIDGTNYPYDKQVGEFVKLLKSNCVVVKIKKGYFEHNVWRKRKFLTPVDIEVADVITKEEVEELDLDIINSRIEKGITFNDFDYVADDYSYKQLDKAVGLENVLYICPKCKKLYKMASLGNRLYCEACGEEFVIQDNYFFNNRSFPTIHEFYSEIKNIEKKNIKKSTDYIIESNVKAKVFYPKSRKNQLVNGSCILTKDDFKFICDKEELSFTKKIKDIKALDFTINSHFETYYNDRLYCFYPKNSKESTRWALLVDVLKEMEK